MSVLLLPAADRADEVAAQMLAKVLEPLGFETEVPSAATLKSEMVDGSSASSRRDLRLGSAPAAVVHARYLGKKLTAVAPGVPVLVGLWDAQGDLTKARQRLESVGLRTIATDAATIVRELIQLRLPLLQGVRSRGTGTRALRNRATADVRAGQPASAASGAGGDHVVRSQAARYTASLPNDFPRNAMSMKP
jgi:hypothetical protein